MLIEIASISSIIFRPNSYYDIMSHILPIKSLLISLICLTEYPKLNLIYEKIEMGFTKSLKQNFEKKKKKIRLEL